LSRLLNKTQLT